MTIAEFKRKWAPTEEPHLEAVFTKDLFTVIENLADHPYRSTVMEALCDVEGSELVIARIEDAEDQSGSISFGPKDKSNEAGITICYSLAYGQHELDWLLLLKCIAAKALTTMK